MVIDWRLIRPPGRSAAVAGREEGLEVLGADRFEHLDRDDRVVGALDVAIVAQLDSTRSLEAGRADALGASSCCAREIVTVVTRQPSSPAAYRAKPPQPVPISRTCWPRSRPAFAAMSRYLLRCASASDWSGVAKTALE